MQVFGGISQREIYATLYGVLRVTADESSGVVKVWVDIGLR